MRRKDSLGVALEYFSVLTILAVVLGIGSLIVQAIWGWIGVGIFGFRTFAFCQIFGLLYIAFTFFSVWLSREALLRTLRDWWVLAYWERHPLVVVRSILLRLTFVFVILITTALATTTAWNWVATRLWLMHLISFRNVLIALLVAALPYFLCLGWLNLGAGLLWRQRFWREKKRVAEARSRGECSREEALEMAERWAELDTQEGLKTEVVTYPDQEE